MKHLGRIGIFTSTIKQFLVNLKRHHKDEFNELDLNLRDRYLKKEEESAFSMVKPSQSAKTLQMVADDLFFLINRFGLHADIPSMKTYQRMTRVLKEQCIMEQDENTHKKRITLKANKDIPSDSLQNPSDPDASYDGHKGKGYQVQVAETYSVEEGNDANKLSLITYIDRFRAGVEATMSQLDRRTGIKHLRVRGMKAVRFAATMKATALNIIRVAAYKKRQNKGKSPSSPSFGGLIRLILVIKVRFFKNFGKIAKVETAMAQF